MSPVLALVLGAAAGHLGRMAADRFERRIQEGATEDAPVAAAVLVLQPGAAELLGGSVALALIVGAELPAMAATALTFALVAVAATDALHRLIPDAASAAIALLALMTPTGEDFSPALRLGTAGVLGGGLLLLHLTHRRFKGEDGIGLGDVKLLGALALWLTPLSAALMLAGATLLALLWLAGRRLRGREDAGLALAPFAVMAFVLVLSATEGFRP